MAIVTGVAVGRSPSSSARSRAGGSESAAWPEAAAGTSAYGWQVRVAGDCVAVSAPGRKPLQVSELSS
jgi:hypothetical protein